MLATASDARQAFQTAWSLHSARCEYPQVEEDALGVVREKEVQFVIIMN
jgi:hypothetical protein